MEEKRIQIPDERGKTFFLLDAEAGRVIDWSDKRYENVPKWSPALCPHPAKLCTVEKVSTDQATIQSPTGENEIDLDAPVYLTVTLKCSLCGKTVETEGRFPR
ncbi:MAG: hypothetical protein WC277_06560 [Bacilli bacterium]|jgi:hypothetical protein